MLLLSIEMRMTIYWTLERPDSPTEGGLGSKEDFLGWLEKKNLPHTAPSDWIVDICGTEQPDGRSIYIHEPTGKPEWTLTWGSPKPGVDDISV